MSLIKPIFVVGAGRSGSTIFHQVFCRHPQTAWISKLCDLAPTSPWMNNLLMDGWDAPGIGVLIDKLLIEPSRLKPSEAYDFWEYYCPGFSKPCRDLYREDVTNKKKKRLRKVLGTLATKKRPRLLVKITGWPRITFLQEIWPDAKFINIVRDPRAVVNSILEVDWWNGWRGPQGWTWGELTPEQQAEWERHNRSFEALAAIEMNILRTATEKAKESIDLANFMEIRYEDLCDAPIDIFKDVVQFTELDWSHDFAQSITSFKLRNTNYKWQEDLTAFQQDALHAILADYLKDYNYD